MALGQPNDARHTSAWTRLLLAAAPLALGAALIGAVACGDGGNKRDLVEDTPAPTATPAPPTPSVEQVLRYFAAILPTATPEPEAYTGGGGGGGGGATGGGAPYRPSGANLTGPGPIVGTDMTIVSPAANINANVSARSVGTNGQMGDPIGAWMVLWYDFSQNYPGLGGYPGDPGANAVFAGHVDYIRVGPAVFWSVGDLQPGDIVTVNTANGPINYAIQWSTWSGPYDDFTGYVAQTGEELITLVTCVGQFSGGHYSNRLIVRGKRI